MTRTLEEQRREFASRRFLAMPLAGSIMWSVALVAALTLPARWHLLTTFIASGMIVYVGMFVSRFTGEDFLDKTRPKNEFSALFFYATAQAILVFTIGIPFAIVDNTSVPLSVGIIGGLMWLPTTWIIQHWIGTFHALVRSLGIVLVWYLFPTQRFVVIPLVILAVYAVTIVVLESRYRALQAAKV